MPSDANRTRASRWRRALLLVSLALLGILWLCYLGRFDFCAAVTVLPAWVWLIPGLFLVGPEWWGGNRRWGAAGAGLWFAFAVFARKTRNSDHRMVVCDLRLPDPHPQNERPGSLSR